MKGLGIIVLLFGLALTVMTGFNLTSKEKAVDLSGIEITKESHLPINWSPLVGIALIIAGGGFYKLSENERFTNN